MATTADADLAERMRTCRSWGPKDAWNRYSGGRSWDYRIVAPGYKYNMTDVAAAIGIHQLRRAESMRLARQTVAARFCEALADVAELDLPAQDENRVHAWHLFPIRLRLDRLSIGRNAFIDGLKDAGVGCSVHWRPLHLHAYYEETFRWRPEDFPVATEVWERLVSLPIFPDMREEEVEHVVASVKSICLAHRKSRPERSRSDPDGRRRRARFRWPRFASRGRSAAVDRRSVDRAPVIALAGIGLVLSSGFPIFFRQTRVGRGARPFTLVKLRTMRRAAS
jgi:perosamine synthetase